MILASRAFFRCRACGEPVVAGAYKCPVCGVDFPAGTPGAPKAPPGPDDIVTPGDLDFTEALREATGGRVPVPPEPEPEPDPDEAMDFVADEPDDAPVDVDVDDDRDTLDIAPGVSRGTAPPVELHEHGGKPSEDAVLNVRPREEGRAAPGSTGSALAVRPVRTDGTVVAQPAESKKGKALTGETPRRRARSRSLAGTLLVALILIGGVAFGAWWVGEKVGVPVVGGIGQPEEITAVAADGWVSIPSADRAFVVNADGPFRMRIDGEVYALNGSRPVRVPQGVDAALKVPRGEVTAVARAVAP